jgi:uncharacterized protein
MTNVHSKSASPGPRPSFSLEGGPAKTGTRLILAHGAGAGITSPFMDAIAALFAERGLAFTLFEFGYMAARREGGSKRPPPRAEALVSEFRDRVRAERKRHRRDRFIIGGKSMGGRVASLLAGELHAEGDIAGLVCLGYPFHPPGKPDELRTSHLERFDCPALFVQGERDPFGSRHEVEKLKLAPAIRFAWMSDGDHDFGPRGASGFTRKGNLAAAADAVAAFVANLGKAR